MGTPLTGASNADGVGKKLLFSNRWLSIDDWSSVTNNCDGWPCSLPHRRRVGDASVNLCLSQRAWTTTTKRREQTRIYLYAAVNLKRKRVSRSKLTNNRRLRSTYCSIEANYGQTRSIVQPLSNSMATCILLCLDMCHMWDPGAIESAQSISRLDGIKRDSDQSLVSLGLVLLMLHLIVVQFFSVVGCSCICFTWA